MSGRSLKVNLMANTSQFKSAMAETSRQIKLLNSEFRNAAAETDKYGNKIDVTGAKKKQLTGVIEQYKHRIKAIKDEQKHWTNELKKGNITEEQHAQKQQELAQRLNNTEAQMKRYEGQLKKMNAEGKKATMTYAEFDKKFRDVGRTMRNVGAQVGITAGVGFVAMKRVLGDVVGEAADLQAGMSEVQAVSGATTDEIEKLTQQSKDLGKSTVFTAKQASEAQANLARAGFKVNEIYGAMPGLLDLAASSNLDLGTSANITSNIIRTFNFEADKAGQVADVLAKGAATANIDVQGLGESMKTAGPVAKSLGIQFESVAAATGIMADAGIDGSTSGRMLRQGMLRLSKPVGDAEKLIKKLGINVFDADGNMKSLDKVVAELSKGLKGQTKQQKAAALATIFGSESTAGWTVLLDKGSKKLKSYTKDLENSEGAAKEMADVMQDNAQGAIVRMQSALSGLKIELGEKLLPTLTKGADWVAKFAENLSNMDKETVNTVAQTALLTTAVLGATTAVAGIVTAVGAFMAFAGPVGIALTAGTALVGGLGIAINQMRKESEDANEVNLDLADSLTEQAGALENSVKTFDKLNGKAEISNAELAKMYDLHKRMAETSNKDELAKLRSQYDELAEKSGLSKKEITRLFKANEHIIDQSPEVAKSISESGNMFVENTDKVKEYIQSLYDMSLAELEANRIKNIEKEKELRGQITEKQKEMTKLDEELAIYSKAHKMSQDEIKNRMEELNELNKKHVEETGKQGDFMAEYIVLRNILNGKTAEGIEAVQEEKKELKESLDKKEEELKLITEADNQMGNILLKRHGINEEDEKGFKKLEERISKNNEELEKLDKIYEKNGKLTQKQQEKYNKIKEQNNELENTQSYILEELGLYGSVNSLVESKKHLLSEATNEKIKELEKTHDIKAAEGDIIKQLQEKQGKLVEEREQLEANREKQGANKAEIDKQIAAIDTKLAKGDETIVQILDELGILEKVKDGIKLNSSELKNFLIGLGYTVDEAGELAKALVGETVSEMESGAEKAKEAGKNTGKGHADGVESTKGQNKKAGKTVKDSAVAGLKPGKTNAEKHGKDKGDAHAKGLGSTKGYNLRTTTELKNDLLSELGKGDTNANKHGKDKGMAHERGLGSTKSSNLTTSRGISIGVSNLLGKTTDGGGGKKAGRLFGSGLLSHRGNVSSAGRGVAQSGERALRSVKTSGAGSDFVSGFRGSISSGGGSVWSAAWSLGQSALTALRRSIKTASPSKETKKTGKDFVSGYTIAIKKNTKKASAAAKKLGDNTLKNLQVKFDTKKMGTNKYISELKKVQRQYKLTSAQRRKVEKEIFRANSARKDQNKKYAKSIDQINNKYYKLNESYYKNVRKINDKLSKDIKRVKKEYNDQLKSLSQSIYNQVGLFNKVEKKSTDKNVLLNNLKEQNEQFVKFRRNISRIQKKGASKAFVNELRAMGVGSAAEIEAISKMTKAELKTYQNMWKEKKRLADLEAKRQMADEKKRMNAQIKSLRKARDKQLKQEKSEWRRGMKAINKDLRELRDFRKTGIKLGRDTVRGLTAGLRKTGSLKKTSRSLAKTIEKEIKRTLKIKSPSRLMELEVGAMVPAGVVRGIDKGLRMVKQSAHELALSAIPNFDNKTAIEQAVETARLTHGAMTNEMDKMAQNYSAASFVLKQNKEVLKVEHTLDSKFEKFMNLLVNEKVKQDNPIKELLQATLQQNQLLMQLLNKDFKAEVAFDSVYQPIKRRLNEDQYSNFKQRRR